MGNSSSDGQHCSESDSVRLSRLRQAQGIIYDTWETVDKQEKVHVAKEALEISDHGCLR